MKGNIQPYENDRSQQTMDLDNFIIPHEASWIPYDMLAYIKTTSLFWNKP